MNIFKILASGHGSISETNISAFLGYLLNPNEDHGLGSIFLRKILAEHYKFNPNSNLSSLVNENGDIKDLSLGSEYRIEVYLEQAFNDSKTNQIVDVVVFIYKININKTHSLFLNQLKEKRKLINIILIEVKKYSDASDKGKSDLGNLVNQLTKQFGNTKKQLEQLEQLKPEDIIIDLGNKEFLNNISLIYITPKGKNSDSKKVKQKKGKVDPEEVFKDFYNNKTFKGYPKSHLYWKTEDEETFSTLIKKYKENDKDETISLSEDEKIFSIESIIESIISPEVGMRSEIIPTYTSETLQSFSNFIYSDFKSIIKEKSINKEYVEPVHYKTLDELWESKKCKLNKTEFDRVKEIFENINEREKFKIPEHTKTHLLTFYSNNYDRLCSISVRSTSAVMLMLNSIVSEKIKEELDRMEIDWKIGINKDGDLLIKLDNFKDTQILSFIEFLYNNCNNNR